MFKGMDVSGSGVRQLRGRRGMVAICLAVGALAGSRALAGTAYWDVNGTNAGAGGTAPTGTWDNAATNWNPAADGTGVTAAWHAGDTAVFSAGNDATGPFSVTVGATETVGGLTFEEGNVTLSGSTVSLNAGSTISVGSGLSATASTVLAGTNGFALNGGGTLYLRSNSTVTGTKTLTSGTLSIDTTLRFASTGTLLLNGGTMQETNPGSAGSFIPTGVGITVGANGGTVDYTPTFAGGTSTFNSIYSGTISGAVAGSGVLTKTGTGEFRVQTNAVNSNSFGKLVVNGGLYRIGHTGTNTETEVGFGAVPSITTSDAITLNNGAIGNSIGMATDPKRGMTLGSNGGGLVLAAPLTFTGGITGTGSLTIGSYLGYTGANTATLTGTNTYQGPTIMGGAESLVVSGGSAIPDTSMVTFSGNVVGTFQVNTSETAGNIAGGGTSSNILLSGSVLTFGGDNNNTTYSGNFSFQNGIGTIVKTGAGLTALGGTGTFTTAAVTQNITVAQGTLQIGTGGTTGAIGVTSVDDESVLAFNRSDAVAFASTITGAGNFLQKGTGTLSLTGNNSYSGKTTITAGTLQVGNGAATGVLPTDVTNNSILAFNRNDTVSFDHVISGTGSVIQRGTGKTILTASNLYTGPTSVTAGTLSVASDAKLGNTTIGAGVALSGGGTLEASSTFTTARAITTGTGGGGIAVDFGQTLTATAAITGTGGLNVPGPGTLITSNINVGGALNVTGGVTQIVANGATVAKSTGLTISSAILDINDNNLVVSYSGTSPLSTINGYVQSGYNFGTWDGAGIDSAFLHNSGSTTTGIGVADSADVGLASVEGSSLTGNAVVVKYTWLGDSSLDGTVDLGNDFNLFLIGFLTPGTSTWELGDYNYDGHVDSIDFGMFVDGYKAQNGNLGALDDVIAGSSLLTISQKSQLLAVVPEPSSAMVVALGAAGLAARRRRAR